MAQFTEIRTPNEFLVRWNKEGKIQGAHVGWLDTVLKDGVVISQTETNVESVAVGLNEGFPLSDILDKINIDCLLELQKLREEIANLKTPIQK